MKVNTAVFFTNNEKKTNGCFSIDERYKATIRIETEDQQLFNEFADAKILNCMSDNESFFFTELVFLNCGYKTVRQAATVYILEVEAYLYGKGINTFNLDELDIVEVNTSFNYLDKWYKGLAPFAIPYKEHIASLEELHIGKNFSTDYMVNDDLVISLQVYGTKLKNFEEVFQVVFRCKTMKYKDYFAELNSFGRLLSLCCNLPVEINREITCFLSEGHFTLYRYLWELDKKVYPHTLTIYGEIKDRFDIILKSYYNTKELYPVIQIFNSAFYIPNSMVGGISEKFLILVKTIEAMYSCQTVYDFSENEKLFKAEINERLLRIDNKKDRAFFSNKTANAHRATFKMKVIQFLQNFKHLFLKEEGKVELFATMLKDTRNYYTHVNLDGKYIIEECYLSIVNELLKYLITYHLLWIYNGKIKINGRFWGLEQSIKAFNNTVNGNLRALCRKDK